MSLAYLQTSNLEVITERPLPLPKKKYPWNCTFRLQLDFNAVNKNKDKAGYTVRGVVRGIASPLNISELSFAKNFEYEISTTDKLETNKIIASHLLLTFTLELDSYIHVDGDFTFLIANGLTIKTNFLLISNTDILSFNTPLFIVKETD
ncbi:MAG: hypothetical protein R2786_02890 [Flavobacteriaceae bacterium]